MKTLLRLLIVTFFALSMTSQNAISQTVTSVSSGNWLTPTTWDCSCVPTPGANIVINHTVSLNTNWAYSSGSITVSSTGSLQELGGLRAIAVYGTGSLSNNGTIQINKMGFFSGTISNNGSFTVTDSLYLGVALTNGASGTIVSNNFYSKDHLINNGTISAVNFLNDGIYENYDQSHFTDFFNNNTGQNSGTLEFHDFYNNDSFANTAQINGSHDFTNAGTFQNLGNITIENDFSNNDSLNGDAYFNNNGHFYVANDMLNMDTIAGSSSGQYCVAMNSANYGVMTGNFDFCDQTPPASSPYIDLNSGTITGSITYCLTPCNTGISGEIPEISNVSLFPNPASDMVSVTSTDIIERIDILDLAGKLVLQVFPETFEKTLILGELCPGLYFVRIQTEKNVQVIKLQRM